MKNPTYDRITDRIIALLEQGIVPWHKPWTARTSLPRNFVSKNPYRGINVFLLIAMRYESPFWLTFQNTTESNHLATWTKSVACTDSTECPSGFDCIMGECVKTDIPK